MKRVEFRKCLPVAVLAVTVLVSAGCGRRDPEGLQTATTPSEAAGQLDRAFSAAPAEFRDLAGEASSALRSGDFSKAVEFLAVLRGSEDVSLQQGVAVHSSMVLLESRLVAAAAAGDAKASEAYSLLRRMKRK